MVLLKIVTSRGEKSLCLIKRDGTKDRSDDGLGAAVCLVENGKDKLTFAGANHPLVHVNGDNFGFIKGNRQSIGYSRSKLDFKYTDHSVEINNTVFYLYSDGIVDQLGGDRMRKFGSKKFKNMLLEHSRKPMDKQQTAILDTLREHQRDNERQDDVTVMGFRLNGLV